jgi:hypothetical protein
MLGQGAAVYYLRVWGTIYLPIMLGFMYVVDIMAICSQIKELLLLFGHWLPVEKLPYAR